jgi:hypothetical protein
VALVFFSALLSLFCAALGKTCFYRLQGRAEAGLTWMRGGHISARRIV